MSPGPSAERGGYSLLNKIKILLSWREAMDRNGVGASLGSLASYCIGNGGESRDSLDLLLAEAEPPLILRSRWRKEQLKNNQVFILLTAFQSSPGFYVPIGFPQNPGKQIGRAHV